MSFQRECARFGEELAALVGSGVAVKDAAVVIGVPVSRCYAILKAIGRPAGRPHYRATSADTEQVVSVFDVTGSINQAATAAGLSHWIARRILVDAGLVSRQKKARGKPAERRRFAELVAAGWSSARAAREVGVTEDTGRLWRRYIDRPNSTPGPAGDRCVDIGGVHGYNRPVTVRTCDDHARAGSGGRYLSIHDRIVIADGLLVGDSLRTIAARVGKNVSTISREVTGHSINGRYLPYRADQAATAARARPKQAKLVTNTALRAVVEEGLARKLSPEQISCRLRRDHPDDESMQVSHETIYQALYFQARGGLKRQVQQALRTGRTRRKPHHGDGERHQRFTDPMIMISERPAEVADRAVPGHWEGDLITGTQNKSAIGTLVERTTRYTMLLHLPDGHDAETVRDQLIAAMKTLPEHLRGSLTWDQGAEMARHHQFTMATDMAVYFCDPASPWQRGSNENTNGLLRQYFPKGTDLNIYGPEDLEHVAQELNGRPRKTLGWDTPAERLRDLITIN